MMNALTDQQLNEAAECLKVMAHPVRLKMVQILMQGEFPVNEIASQCGISANQTCEHLRLMQGRGFLASHRDGKTVYYKIISPRLPSLIQCIRKNCNNSPETQEARGVSDGIDSN
jgi:ArsR family transcriptional regulator, zinc-responsive transcriptional repressor